MVASKIKLLIWLTILTLTMGCVPSLATPTPIPPLDPNAVSVFIAQTAEAASTQTMEALPPSTATATFTNTPRNTFTPPPTFTPIPTFPPSPTPRLSLKYYRVKHDNQLALYNFKSRTFDDNSDGLRKQTPEIVPLLVAPKESSGTDRTNVSGAWEILIDSLNNNDKKKLGYLKSDSTALFNTAGFPQLESLTMGGNVVTLDSIHGEWAIVHTMRTGAAPSTATVNYVTRPDLIHKFVVVGWKRSTKSTVVVNTPKGDLYWPLVTRRSVWIQMERLEPFPALPLIVTAEKDIYIQKTPGPKIEKTNSQLSEGESGTIVEYYPSGSDVWGRLERSGWIPLLFGRQYRTTWTMDTVPPP